MALEPPAEPAAPALDRLHQILLDTARQLGGSLDPNAIFARMLSSVRAAMRCDGLIVSSFDRDRGLIRCAYACVEGNVLDPASLPPLPYREGSGMQSQVIRTGRPMLFSDVMELVRDPDGRYFEIDSDGAVRDLRDAAPPRERNAIMVPLRLEGEVVGVVHVSADAENVYTRRDLELLEGISLLLAVALENARLFGRLQEELEERLRTERELRQTEEALRHADRRKDEFLATLGHELRNPLNPIRNAVELLRRGTPEGHESLRMQAIIERQIAHLARLIDDLLDVSRITQGKLELRKAPIVLDGVLEAACEAVRPTLEAARQTLEVVPAGQDVRLDADAVRLAQVFSNLLDNAGKYSPHGTRITISVERCGDRVRVDVRDQGRGIPADQRERVFDLFYQGDRHAGAVPQGLGLGLTLVKQLVEMHGGSVEVTSEGEGGGTRFSVWLPVLDAALAPLPPAPPHDALGASGPWRILVADDNRDSADSLAMLLELDGHEVRVAYDGEQALESAADGWPQVALLDIGMPRLDGLQVAERLRARTGGRDLVLIAATGWGQEEDRRRSMASGFDAHLVKPLEPSALLRVMASLAARVDVD